MELIVAIDMNYGIGFEESLLIAIPNDLKNFKELTTNNIVVYGRNTLKSFRGHKPLPNRTNVILTHEKPNENDISLLNASKMDNVIIKNSKEEVLEYVKEQESLGNKVYLIGGAQVYNLFIDYCSGAYITKIYDEFLADKFFPNIDKKENWIIEKVITNEVYVNRENNKEIEYAIIYYKNNNVKGF